MICPSLPQMDGSYDNFAAEMYELVRGEKCEHIWAEVINVRGDSLTATAASLTNAGFGGIAGALYAVSHDPSVWEEYNRQTFRSSY